MRWNQLGTELKEGIIQLTFNLIQDKTRARMIRKKLEQVFCNLIINSFPISDYFTPLLGMMISDPVLCLSILSGIPIELDRRDSLTAGEYDFKHFLSDQSIKIVDILKESYSLVLTNSQLASSWFECVGAWGSFIKFREQSIPIIFSVLNLLDCPDESSASGGRDDLQMPQHQDVFEMAAHCVLVWLECGIESLKELPTLLSPLLALRDSFPVFAKNQEWDRLATMAKIYRLYGELIIEKLVDENSEIAKSFLETILAFTQIEAKLIDPPSADVSLFWVALSNQLDCEEVKGFGWKYLLAVLELLEASFAAIPSKLLPGYKDSLTELVWTIYYSFGDSLFSFCLSKLDPDQRPEGAQAVGGHFASWLVATASTALRSPSETCWSCTKLILSNPSLFPLEDVVELAASIPRHNASASIYPKVFTILLNNITLLPAKTISSMHTLLEFDPETIINDAKIQKLFAQSVTQEVINEGEYVGPFWLLVCLVLGHGQYKNDVINILLRRASTGAGVSAGTPVTTNNASGLDETTISMFDSFFIVTKTRPVEMELIRKLVEAVTVHKPKFDRRDAVATWEPYCALLNRIVNDKDRCQDTIIYNLLEPIFAESLQSLDEHLLKVIESFVRKTNSTMSIAICDSLVSRWNGDDDLLIAVLPVILACCKSNQQQGCPPASAIGFATDQMAIRLLQSTVSDDLLRSLNRLWSCLIDAMNTNQASNLIAHLLRAARIHLNEAQVEICGPVILQLLRSSPQTLSKVIEAELSMRTASPTAVSTERREAIKRLLLCTTPRKFTLLLMNILKQK